MKKKFFILFILLFVILTILFLWWYQATKPRNSQDITNKVFTVKKSETVRNIADRLENEGLIRSPVAFFLLSRFGGISQKIQAGDFHLNPSMNLQTIAESLTHGTVDTWIVIPEGWRNEEIARSLAKDLNIPEKEFLMIAKEGYMFPDTYLFPQDASATTVSKTMMDNFNKKIDVKLRNQMNEKNLSLENVVTIASLVEREAKFDEDRPLIASVILNRLKENMKLDIDATIQYALGYQSDRKTWWKQNLTVDDLGLDSPYNTYTHAGLPPTPIANPGLEAIQSVINAQSTPYIFYIADKTGKSHFAKTLEEHNFNIQKYLQNNHE